LVFSWHSILSDLYVNWMTMLPDPGAVYLDLSRGWAFIQLSQYSATLAGQCLALTDLTPNPT